jgi:signal recognition particle subunit SRP54
MLQSLQDKLSSAFSSLRGKSSLSEKDIDAALKEVRVALLEADVNFRVAKEFCRSIADKAKGESIMRSLSPGQQVIKIVHEELINLMGMGAAELNLSVAPPCIIMLVGLQGSGKTTSAAKLALYLRKEKKRSPLLVPADVYRPAAIEQLQTLGKQLDIDVFASDPSTSPLTITKLALEQARNTQKDLVIIDTAGRLQVDEALMDELREIKTAVTPHEILLVADAMTGQEAVNVAEKFNEVLSIDGLILTKLDGDARGGAALSMKAVTQKPIKFIGVGEKPDAFELFHPERLASRILGMGDVLSLIERASKEVSEEEAKALQKKLKKNTFSLEDFLNQLRMVKRMGSISSIASMLPGMSNVLDDEKTEQAEREMRRIEAIILSMTAKERQDHSILNGSRRRRIAQGSGTSVEEVNKLLKQFLEMKKVMGALSKGGMGGLMNMMGGRGGAGGLGKLFGR